MFSNFIDTENLRSLPLSANQFYLTINGGITDHKGVLLETHLDNEGDIAIYLHWLNEYKQYKLCFLMACTFKPLIMPYKYWHVLNILFKDGNNRNVHPSNLIWKFPSKGIECKQYPGFYYIPCFTRFLINKEGTVMSFLTKNILSGSLRKEGYVYFCIRSDIGKVVTIGRHRLLAITFLGYESDVDLLDVNHIDGIPGNDWVSNLEWATRSKNVIHAYANNLRADNKPVIVIDHRTGEETEYFSAHECERQLGLNRSNVHWRIKFGKGKIYPPGLSFRYKDELTPDGVTPVNNDHYGIKIRLTDTLTNEIVEFSSIRKCAKHIGVSKKVIQKRIKKGINDYKHFKIERL